MQDLFTKKLEALRTEALARHLREISSPQGPEVEVAGDRLINFSSNDYLGLANDATLRDAAISAIKQFGVGAGASRLISGTQSPHVRLEHALAKWKGTEAALCFSSGYAAAVGTIPALVGRNDVVLLDKLCHASLIDGAKLSGAILRVFPHNDCRKLGSHLEWARRQYPGRRVLIVTESVFSMDGDLAPLPQIVQLKKDFGALLMLDEAHAVGVIGQNGRGLAIQLDVNDEVDVQMGTLSKALGTSGGYICASGDLIEWLINRARSFIYSTAPPPATAAAALAAVDFLASPQCEERRLLLWDRINLLRELLLQLDVGRLNGASKRTTLNVQRPTFNGESGSAIFPLIIGANQSALDLATALQQKGFLVPAIRYPTVAKGSARLRITITSAHQEDHIRSLCEAITRNCCSQRPVVDQS
ncbi:MAG TPA: 8-amino-7-oxononanoate synthase [Candidatus Udaeobacter sp.]|jgi:8-amino-7-oxononanoate synthase|nr:8-amino-7-oxononanoate synthase [Candidatus Udaeobacter sp.]